MISSNPTKKPSPKRQAKAAPKKSTAAIRKATGLVSELAPTPITGPVEVANPTEKSKPLSQNSFIQKPFKDADMAQIYSSGLEYAWINAVGEQCHPFAYCKDFLQDAVKEHLNQGSCKIYGFAYDSKTNPPLSLDKTRLAVRFSGRKDLEALCQNSLRFMQAVEADLGFLATELAFGADTSKGQAWVFISDPYWMQAPPLISLYSLLLRVGLNYESGDWRSHLKSTNLIGRNDRDYLSGARKVIDKLSKDNIREIFATEQKDNYLADCSVNTMHNNSGVCAWASGDIPAEVNRNWRMKTI